MRALLGRVGSVAAAVALALLAPVSTPAAAATADVPRDVSSAHDLLLGRAASEAELAGTFRLLP